MSKSFVRRKKKTAPARTLTHAELAAQLYAFRRVSNDESLNDAMDKWSELSPEDQTFTQAHLVYLQLQTQAQQVELLQAIGRLVKKLEALMQESLTSDDPEDDDDDNSNDNEDDNEDDNAEPSESVRRERSRRGATQERDVTAGQGQVA